MQQFRLVQLDDYDNVIDIEYESEVFPSNDEFDHDFRRALYDCLVEADNKYNFIDYDNAPIMEFQRRVTDRNGVWGPWRFLSDPVSDVYNW